MSAQTVAYVGAAGGAGTTRTTLECATLLARHGRDVAVLDAAFGTQGLADRTNGRIETDVTELCLGDEPLETGLVDRDVDGAGRLAVCPARAPFERLARAKASSAATSFESLIAEAGRAFDHVLVDSPPIASNQAVAAATAGDAVAIVGNADRAPATLPRTRDRLSDVGVEASATVVTRTDEHADADVTVPNLKAELPAVGTDEAVDEALARVVAATLDVEIDVETQDGLRSKVPF